MKLSLKYVRYAVFLVILIFSLIVINKILEPKYTLHNSSWPTTSTYNQFYRMDRDTIDVLFFGSSVAASTFIPQVFYDEYGITSYNLGSEQQSIFLSYYWLKEALRFQSPKVVVLDLEFMENYHPESPINTKETITRKSIDPMKWSGVKLQAVHNICDLDSSQSELSYFLTNIRFHSRWKEINHWDIDDSMSRYAPLKGYAPIAEKGPEEYEPFIPNDTDEIHEFQSLMEEYLDKFVVLCYENDIQLMVVNLPGATMDDAINHTHEAYAEENGIDYVNLCTPEHIEGIDAMLPEENIVYHENIWGAVKTSRYIGKLLKEKYELEPVTDYQYEETRQFFNEILDSFNLLLIKDAEEYLDAVDKPYLEVTTSEDEPITIDGTEYESPGDGESIVVYDRNMNRVVDHVIIHGKEGIQHKLGDK